VHDRLSRRGIGMTSPRARERLVTTLRDAGITDPHVLEAIRNVPRHLFIDEALANKAYDNISLPIGNGQTISQPYIVARMTATLSLADSNKKVLEVGTGSGYQTAILAELAGEVFTVERIAPLQERARSLLRQLSYKNIRYKHSDGGYGWPEKGPYDAIIVTCAPESIPEELLPQLKPGGRLVIPVGAGDEQQLYVITNTERGFEREYLEPVRFVPLVRQSSGDGRR